MGISRIGTRKSPELGPAAILEIDGKVIEIRHNALETLDTAEKLLAEAEQQAGVDLPAVFFHINRDGSLAMATGTEPEMWPENYIEWRGWITEGIRAVTPYDYGWDGWPGWEGAIDRAVSDGANTILDWSWISKRWWYLFEPYLSDDIETLRRQADYIRTNHPDVRYIIYISPFEYVTPHLDDNLDGVVDAGKENESLALQHPKWSQMGIDGRRAVFYGSMPGMPSWVSEHAECIWVTPACQEFRDLIIQQAKCLATTGIDGIYLDAAHLRYDFGDDWQGQWPDVGPEARNLFQIQTGHILPEPPMVPDWDDPTWLAFVSWRYRLIREFIEEYRAATNGKIQLIVSTSSDFSNSSLKSGCSLLDLPRVASFTAHERGWDWTEKEGYYGWLVFVAELLARRQIDRAHGHPSWLSSYVAEGDTNTARFHAACVILAEFGYFVGIDDIQSVPDPDFQRELFAWLKDVVLYSPQSRTMADVAVLFSQPQVPTSVRPFLGTIMMLLESHIAYEVVGAEPSANEYQAIIVPGESGRLYYNAASEPEAEAIRLAFVDELGVIPRIVTDAPRSVWIWPLERDGTIEFRIINATDINITNRIPTPQTINVNLSGDWLDFLGSWAPTTGEISVNLGGVLRSGGEIS